MVRGRLAETERRHYELTLQDASLTGMDHSKQKQEIEDTMTFFRDEITAAEAAVAAQQ